MLARGIAEVVTPGIDRIAFIQGFQQGGRFGSMQSRIH
ncbi:hypothetical protein C6341_g27939 [Phytophthora cactorum]|nr:hypothetical protein C6341_g27939 [Phytophthora cactorum]